MLKHEPDCGRLVCWVKEHLFRKKIITSKIFLRRRAIKNFCSDLAENLFTVVIKHADYESGNIFLISLLDGARELK